MWSLLLSFGIAIVFVRYAVNITKISFAYYFWPIMALLLWASVQYTGGIQDYIMFGLMCVLGMILKNIKFSRAAFIIGFVLADRLEGVGRQFFTLYNVDALYTRPISLSLICMIIFVVIYGLFFNKAKVEYV